VGYLQRVGARRAGQSVRGAVSKYSTSPSA